METESKIEEPKVTGMEMKEENSCCCAQGCKHCFVKCCKGCCYPFKLCCRGCKDCCKGCCNGFKDCCNAVCNCCMCLLEVLCDGDWECDD